MHDHLVNEIKKAPFFAIIGDTTTDISKVDQYSNVIRYVYFDPENKIVEVRETFLGLHAVHDQSAEGITDMIYGISNRSGLDIQKCRGQGYDGASVMSGVYSGVQQRIQQVIPNAVYVHCLCHRLNLILCDTAEACSAIKKFFGILQEIHVYVFFGGSAPRWALLQALSSEEKAISLKGLSNTRWESRHSSVFALLARFPDVIKTLTRLKLTSDKAPVRHKAGALLENIVKMEFLVPLVFWEQILQFTNRVSKMLQSETVDLSVATELLKLPMDNVQSLHNNFEAICQTAGLVKK